MDLNCITKDMFMAYEEVRKQGNFNMATEACYAANAAELDMHDYWTILFNYSALKQKFTGKT